MDSAMQSDDAVTQETGKPVAVDRILDAAQVAFASHGFEAVNVQQIADKAGVSAKLIYHYFTRKENLYVEALTRMSRDFFDNFEPPYPAGEAPLAIVREFGLRFADYYLENPQTGRLVLDQVVRGGKEISRSSRLEDLREGLLEPVELALSAGIADGTIKPDVSAQGVFFHLIVLTLGYGTVLSLLDPWHMQVPELENAPLREVIADAIASFVRA